MATTTVNGIRFAYDEAGAGPSLIWVHGSWTNRHGSDLVVPLLAERYRTITYDRRGHSETERPPGPQGVSAHVSDLAALIEQFGAAPAHLLANSFGGEIALKLAAARPELVGSLSLHEPPLYGLLTADPEMGPVLDDMQARVDHVVAEIEQGNHEAAARRFIETVALGPGAWDTLSEESRRTCVFNAPTWLDDVADPTQGIIDVAQVSAIGVPVLLTAGERSRPEDTAVVRRLADALPHGRRYTFAEAGHIPHMTHPQALAEVVLGFLDDVMATASR